MTTSNTATTESAPRLTRQASGYAAQSATTPLAPFTFQRRDLRASDVRIEILYTGVCHSDLHQARNDWGSSTYPMVPG
ncbi:MAG TPA: alcohol dehydrogenase catalytic domain-containing protein, partial [Terriglobales bacterium]